jgi:hypothetical protein
MLLILDYFLNKSALRKLSAAMINGRRSCDVPKAWIGKGINSSIAGINTNVFGIDADVDSCPHTNLACRLSLLIISL